MLIQALHAQVLQVGGGVDHIEVLEAPAVCMPACVLPAVTGPSHQLSRHVRGQAITYIHPALNRDLDCPDDVHSECSTVLAMAASL